MSQPDFVWTEVFSYLLYSDCKIQLVCKDWNRLYKAFIRHIVLSFTSKFEFSADAYLSFYKFNWRKYLQQNCLTIRPDVPRPDVPRPPLTMELIGKFVALNNCIHSSAMFTFTLDFIVTTQEVAENEYLLLTFRKMPCRFQFKLPSRSKHRIIVKGVPIHVSFKCMNAYITNHVMSMNRTIPLVTAMTGYLSGLSPKLPLTGVFTFNPQPFETITFQA